MAEEMKSAVNGPRWRKAVVTGASSGIGGALVGRLAAQGTHVIAAGRDPERTAEAARRARAMARAEALVADLSTDDGVRAVQACFGAKSDPPIDLLVNCAGFGITAPFAGTAESRLVEVLAVNVTALVRLCRTAAEHLPRGGAILNISSIGGFRPVAGSAVYAAAKTFVNYFSMAIGQELRDRGISVVCVCPGFTDTRFLATARLDTGVVTELAVPDHLWQTADEVAEVALSALADDDRALVLTSEQNGESARRSLAKGAAGISVRAPRAPSAAAQADVPAR